MTRGRNSIHLFPSTTVAPISLQDYAGDGGYVYFISIKFTTMISSFIHPALVPYYFPLQSSCLAQWISEGARRAAVIVVVSQEVSGVNLGQVYHYIFHQRPSSQISISSLFLVVCERNSSRRLQYLTMTICMGGREGRKVVLFGNQLGHIIR